MVDLDQAVVAQVVVDFGQVVVDLVELDLA